MCTQFSKLSSLDCAWVKSIQMGATICPTTFNIQQPRISGIQMCVCVYNLAPFGQKRLIALNYITFRRRDDIIHRTRESGSEDSSEEMCKWNKHWNHSRLHDPNPTFDSQKSFPRDLTKKLHCAKCH
jgi:hypothetical protein